MVLVAVGVGVAVGVSVAVGVGLGRGTVEISDQALQSVLAGSGRHSASGLACWQ